MVGCDKLFDCQRDGAVKLFRTCGRIISLSVVLYTSESLPRRQRFTLPMFFECPPTGKERPIGSVRVTDMSDEQLQAGLHVANRLAADGLYHDALSVAEQLVQQFPRAASAHFSRAMALVLLNRLPEAVSDYRTGLLLEDHPAAYRNLGKALEKLGCRQEALAAYQRALDLVPHHPSTVARVAMILQSQRIFDQSEALLRSALAASPHDAGLQFQLGNALADQSRHAEALRAYHAVRELNPDSAQIHYNIGHVLSLLQRWQESIAAFAQAVELAPDYVNAYIEKGIAHVRHGDAAAAEEVFRSVLQIDPRSWQAAVCLGDLLASRDRCDDALVAYEHAAQLAEDKLAARLGLTYARCGRLEEAVTRLLQAHQLNPQDEQILKFLGLVYWQRDMTMDAEWAFQKVVELQPKDRDGYRFLVHILVYRNRREDAIRLLQRWLAAMPDDPIALHLSQAIVEGNGMQRATDDYVTREFDGFADSFDEVLTGLQYRAPELVGEAVVQAIGNRDGQIAILDAGCGTGLCATHLARRADRLDGVDLSEKMLRRAAERELYDQLVKAELTEYLLRPRGNTMSSWPPIHFAISVNSVQCAERRRMR